MRSSSRRNRHSSSSAAAYPAGTRYHPSDPSGSECDAAHTSCEAEPEVRGALPYACRIWRYPSQGTRAFRNLAVEHQFRVTRAFKFFEDHFVHADAGFDKRRGDDRQRAAFFDIASRAEKALWPLQRVGVHTAGSILPDDGTTVL